MGFSGRLIVYGGKGALGNACVSAFKSKNWWVASIDLAVNDDAHANVLVKPTGSWTDQESQVLSDVATVIGSERLDAVICVAGGWAGGNATHKDFIKNADAMWKQSVWASSIAAAIAAKHLKEGGFISLPGAAPAVSGTPGMIGYGMAKAAIHQLTKSLAAPDSGLPANCNVVATLPLTLDTPMNRKWMSAADKSTWTPMDYIVELFVKWTQGHDRVASGSLVKFITEQNQTRIEIV
ncbi:dihydropteridine reductase-like [Artemia franciscana]|uniref:Dihydropteridine reductase n=1 Tax=Artemia franciscana TaxID=6661 RepID=A0AA88HSG5_ARTSF|nr:hypothetical protein QYM36_011740 [Artemia franciscana]